MIYTAGLAQHKGLKVYWELRPRNKSPRNEFPFSPASRSDCQSSSSSQGLKCLDSSFTSVVFRPRAPPSRPLSAVTAQHYYDRRTVALLWQQAGRPSYELLKGQPVRERERGLRSFKHHQDPGNTKNFTFIIHASSSCL